MTVLVLSEDCDPTTDAVVHTLTARGVPVLRCDLGWFPSRLSLAGELTAQGWHGTLHTPEREVSLSGLRSIWYRSPSRFTFPSGLSSVELQHVAHEAKFGLGGVLWSLPVLWVNHPARQADLYKPLQLAVAQRCGLRVPSTLVTNSAAALEQYVTALGAALVVKPLSFSSIREDDTRKAIYTHVLTGDDLADLRGVEVTTHLFQRYISDKAFEVRLTVVGERMFAAAITSASQAATVDFRSDYASLDYQIIDLPAQVSAGVREFMSRFGLTFGAFDFSVDRDQVWWFLECNPAGQYGFVEQATGQPITAAMSDLLERGVDP